MRAVWFQSTEQAIEEIEAILADGGRARQDADRSDSAEATGA